MTVYFIRAFMPDGLIKIGSSSFPPSRLVSLLSWSPVPLEIVATIPGDATLERRIHGLLRESRSHSEWFHPTPEVEAVVEAAISGTLDVDALPPPFDIRNKAGSVGDGMGHLATSISMRMIRAAKMQLDVPDDVRSAYRRFSNNPYQVGWGLKRDVQDAVFVCAWLDQRIAPTEAAKRRLSDAVASQDYRVAPTHKEVSHARDPR